MSSLSLFGTSCAAAVLCVTVASAAPVDDYSSFFVFGDSLSDPGNLFKATSGVAPASPPYFEGRFSNGPVWAEGLVAEFQGQSRASASFAFGGAQAVMNGDAIPDLGAQLQIFAANVPPLVYGSRPLAALWFGANDLFGAIGTLASEEVKAVARGAAQAVSAGATALMTAGIRDVVIFNLPDLGRLPAYALFQPERVADATAGTTAFNAELDAQVDALRTQGMRVTEIDAKALFDQLLADPTKFGVMNATVPCVIPGVGVCLPAALPSLAFFDPVHPTAVIHGALQGEVRTALAPVPLPLPVVMLGTALLGLFGLSRRRASRGDRAGPARNAA